MRELQDFVRSCGYNTEIECDGSLHRFKIDSTDSKQSGWYIFFQNHTTKTGEAYYVGMIGSWKSGDEYTYQSQKPVNKQDKDLIKRKIEQAQAKVEKEKIRINEETKIKVNEIFNSLSEGISEYHQKKGLTKPYGARLRSNFISGDALHIPMRDIEGTLWSVQRIFQDGQKRFESGGRVKGCFHTIGNIESAQTIYICEGFATAATVHEATGSASIAAFSANNLVDCARIIKAKFPEKAFVIAGDNDETGRQKAEEAAKVSLGEAVFPDEIGKDFNDIGTVKTKEILLKTNPKKRYVIALGYNRDAYYFVSSINQQIQNITASSLTSSGLMRLQSIDYWEALYPGKKSPVDWTKAASDLIEACHAKGVFRPERIRGRGVWIDNDKIIYHRGDSLFIDGKNYGLHDVKTKHTYNQDEEMPHVHSKPLTVEECVKLHDVGMLLRFKEETDKSLFLGFLVIAPICGAINWRPHVWLTGQSGTGKSYILNEIVKPLLNGMCNFVSGQTTEAGLRQKTGVSALPVLFDEFESNGEDSTRRVQQVLELARQASSDSEAVVAKGSSSGESVEYRPRFSLMASSVRPSLNHEEDINRFSQLELTNGNDENKVEQFENLKLYASMIRGDYGARLFSRTISMIHTIRASQEVLQKAFATKHTMRTGQQFSALLSGYWALMSDDVIDDSTAAMFADQVKTNKETDDTKDQDDCLNFLLQSILTVRGDGTNLDISIEKMLKLHDPKYEDFLSMYGLEFNFETKCLYIAYTHTQIKKIYSRTKWANCFSKSILRVEGSSQGQKWFQGKNTRMIKVQLPQEMFKPSNLA